MAHVYKWIFDHGRGALGKLIASCAIGGLVGMSAGLKSDFSRDHLGWFALAGAAIGGYAGGGLLLGEWLKARRVARGLPPTWTWRKRLLVGLAVLLAAPLVGGAAALVMIVLGLD